MNRRWFSLINIPVQLGLLALFMGGLLSVIVILGSFTWFCLSLFDRFVAPFLTDPAVFEGILAFVMERAYLALGTMGVVLAIFSFLVLRMTNRIAGPLYRITQELRHIERTGEIHEIRVREHDFYQEFVEVLNRVLRMANSQENPGD